MESLLKTASDYYIIFIIISALLILALIGYIADKNVNKDITIKKKKEDKKVNIINLEVADNTVTAENSNNQPNNQT